MKGYAKVASVGFLVMGLIAIPNLSPAADGSSNREGDGRHRLLNNKDFQAKVEQLRDKVGDRHEHQHNQGGIPGSVTALQTEVSILKTALAEMVANEASLLSQLNVARIQLSALDARLKLVENGGGGSAIQGLTELAKYVRVDQGVLNGVKGPHVVFTGVNLHLRSGGNATNDGGALSGLGNLIVGYNEMQTTPVAYDGAGCDRTLTGSHNIVMGDGNMFASYGGLVIGTNHCITSPNTSILAGDTNEAHGPNSAILGGKRNGTYMPNQTVPMIR